MPLKYYAVHVGRRPGVYNNWDDCKAQTNGFPGPIYKSFPTRAEAQLFAQTGGGKTAQGYYCVARGHKPGVYTTWAATVKQIKGFPNARHKKFDTLDEARRFFQQQTGVRKRDVQVYETHFANFKGFVPQPNAPFEEEFGRLASSQGWHERSEDFKRERTIALSQEIQHLYFPKDEPQIKQEDGDEIAPAASQLTPEQRELLGYQNMCRQVKKQPGETVPECIDILKGRPFVNIVDFCDARRRGEEITLWHDWDRFVAYTLSPGKRVHLETARADKFLSTLLQDLTRGPNPDSIDRGPKLETAVIDTRVAAAGSRVVSGRVEKRSGGRAERGIASLKSDIANNPEFLKRAKMMQAVVAAEVDEAVGRLRGQVRDDSLEVEDSEGFSHTSEDEVDDVDEDSQGEDSEMFSDSEDYSDDCS